MKRRSFVALPLSALGLRTSVGAEEGPDGARERWLPLSDVQLTAPAAGNALDFSVLAFEGIAGQHGWARALPAGGIGFERKGIRHRFLCASMLFNPPNGGLPPKEEVGSLVEELQRTGYNSVRLHYIDAALMQGRDKDFDVDPVGLDRLQFLMAQLKAAGIYWIADAMSSDNGAYGDVGPNRYARRHNAKGEALVSEAGFAHWAKLVDSIWGVANPYTKLAPLADPAMLGIILINEGGLAFLATVTGGRYPDSLAAPFAAWLKARYRRDQALGSAWGSELRSDESVDRQVALPATVRGQSRRDKDFARFVGDLEVAGLRRMEAHVRARGFGGLATAFDNWDTLASDVSRSSAAWVDMHAYHTLPTKFAEPGSRVEQTSLLGGGARAVRQLTNARQWGKPFTVSEYGQPFWNRFRYEISALLPAVAAHQGWDMICNFTETPIQASYGPSRFARRQAIYPFGVGADPIERAGERLAAMLYLRGDVKQSGHRIRLHVRPDALLERSAGWEQVPEAASRLAFVAPIGLDFGPLPERPVPGEISIDLMAGAAPWLARLQNAMAMAGANLGDDLVAPLRSAGIIDAANRTRPELLRYESDTHQCLLDSRDRTLTIDTPRTAVVVIAAGGGGGSTSAFVVEQASAAALFAVSALDGKALKDSLHLLFWVLTDANNTGMSFADADHSTLAELGKFPPLVRTVAARLSLDSSHAGDFKGWALGLNGQRRESVQLQSSGRKVSLAVDTGTLPGGPALFFELAAK